DRRRRERVDLTFGLDGAPWDPERTLERYELLWETGLVAESGLLKRSTRRRVAAPGEPERSSDPPSGLPLARDHRRMLATALGRVRGKLKYRPVVFELLPAEFTLLQLQRTVEALAGARLHKQNFRRLVETAGLVERTGRFDHATRGRPAELFRFRHEVFRERPAPGVYFAGAWWAR
ncbi:MAG TPA: NAD regulator, partial [Candidatus Saccharimonadia bacterium]|nr:NAD regulator [Candidatus Saccharimonadia bacterium]